MGTLSRHDLSIDLPTGWEGRIKRRDAASAGALLHAANFALPTVIGDFGAGAVELMSNRDLLVVLFEYDRASASTALFSAPGIPRLRPDDFSPVALQRVLQGQGGTQKFFNQAGRALCLYVVLGSYTRRVRTVPVINGLLASLRIA